MSRMATPPTAPEASVYPRPQELQVTAMVEFRSCDGGARIAPLERGNDAGVSRPHTCGIGGHMIQR
jgi:hypothetical protein